MVQLRTYDLRRTLSKRDSTRYPKHYTRLALNQHSVPVSLTFTPRGDGAVRPLIVGTSAGVVAVPAPGRPSWPFSLPPQQTKRPDVVDAHV